MYPRQSGPYAYAPQQPPQYPSQQPQYYETANYYQPPPQQQPQPTSQFAIAQPPVVPQFHVFTQPVAVYAQYPYQQQQPPQPQQVQVSPDPIYYNRQAAPTAIVASAPQPAQPKQISQLNHQPEQIGPQYHLMAPQQSQVSQISNSPAQQLMQQPSGYVPQPLKKKDKIGYPQSSMMLSQAQTPSVYQQQQSGQMQIPMRQQMALKQQQFQQPNQISRNTEEQLSSNFKQFHFNQNDPPGCFDIIGRGNLPSVIFESDVQLM